MKPDGSSACRIGKVRSRARGTRMSESPIRPLRQLRRGRRRRGRQRRRRRRRRRFRCGQFLRGRLSLFPGHKVLRLDPEYYRPAGPLSDEQLGVNELWIRLCVPQPPVPARLPSSSRPLAVKLAGQTDIRRRACPPSLRRRRARRKEGGKVRERERERERGEGEYAAKGRFARIKQDLRGG